MAGEQATAMQLNMAVPKAGPEPREQQNSVFLGAALPILVALISSPGFPTAMTHVPMAPIPLRRAPLRLPRLEDGTEGVLSLLLCLLFGVELQSNLGCDGGIAAAKHVLILSFIPMADAFVYVCVR